MPLGIILGYNIGNLRELLTLLLLVLNNIYNYYIIAVQPQLRAKHAIKDTILHKINLNVLVFVDQINFGM